MCTLGVTKVVTVDIRGSWQRWLKVRDLTKGVTYCFRVQAKTIAYGPEAEANITAGPVKGELHNQTNTPTKTDQQTSQGRWAQLTFPTPQREVSEIQAVEKHMRGSISHSGVGVCFSFRLSLTRVGSLACSSQFTAHSPLCVGSPGSPVEMSITKTGSMLNIHWTPGDTGAGHMTGYVIEARPSGTSVKTCY